MQVRLHHFLLVSILFDGDGDFAAVVDELAGACSVGSILGVEAALASDSSTCSMFV